MVTSELGKTLVLGVFVLASVVVAFGIPMFMAWRESQGQR